MPATSIISAPCNPGGQERMERSQYAVKAKPFTNPRGTAHHRALALE